MCYWEMALSISSVHVLVYFYPSLCSFRACWNLKDGWGSGQGLPQLAASRSDRAADSQREQRVRAKWRQIPSWRPDRQASPVDHLTWIPPMSPGHSPPLGGCFQLIKSAPYVEPLFFPTSMQFAKVSMCVLQSCLTLWPYGLKPSRFFCPWDSPCKNARVGCHALLQRIFSTHESNPYLLRLLHWQACSLLLVQVSLVSRNPKGSGWDAIGEGLLLRGLVGTSQASLPCACELPLRATSLQVITRIFLEDSTIEHDCGKPSCGSLETLHDPVCQRGYCRKEYERVTGGSTVGFSRARCCWSPRFFLGQLGFSHAFWLS